MGRRHDPHARPVEQRAHLVAEVVEARDLPAVAGDLGHDGVASGAAAIRQVDLDPHAVADREVVGAEEDQAAAADRVAVPRHGGLAPLARNTQ